MSLYLLLSLSSSLSLYPPFFLYLPLTLFASIFLSRNELYPSQPTCHPVSPSPYLLITHSQTAKWETEILIQSGAAGRSWIVATTPTQSRDWPPSVWANGHLSFWEGKQKPNNKTMRVWQQREHYIQLWPLIVMEHYCVLFQQHLFSLVAVIIKAFIPYLIGDE